MSENRGSESLPILTFHSLDAGHSPISYPPSLFERGLQDLSRLGYRTLTVGAAAKLLREKRRWPERTLVLSFDDGYLSFYRVAFPILDRLGFNATVFVNTGADDVDELPPMYGRRRMRWDQIRELYKSGIEIGAHTATHRDLTRMDETSIEEEMKGSSAVIEAALGAPVDSFCYPFGFQNASAREAAGRHFKCACSTDLGLVTSRSDPYRLERIEMHYFRTALTLKLLTSPLLTSYLSLRRIPRFVRQAVAGHPARHTS